MANAFIATRLAGGWAGQFGELSADLDAARIARRAVPEIAAA
jgi:putative acyl-CoA dehydrogenase